MSAAAPTGRNLMAASLGLVGDVSLRGGGEVRGEDEWPSIVRRSLLYYGHPENWPILGWSINYWPELARGFNPRFEPVIHGRQVVPCSLQITIFQWSPCS